MGIFRKKTIFHVEESMPDPEEIKIRFRRRILFISLLGFFVILGVPVVHSLKPKLRLRSEIRLLVEKIMEARLYAMQSRMPLSLQLESDNQTWKRTSHLPGGNCSTEANGAAETIPAQGVSWEMKLRKENGEESTGRTLCIHPLLGMLLDSQPIENGMLLLTATIHTESGEESFSTGLGIGQFGTEIALIK